MVWHSVFCSLLLLILAQPRNISGQHVFGSSNRSVVRFDASFLADPEKDDSRVPQA
jgi:hypothetical protein